MFLLAITTQAAIALYMEHYKFTDTTLCTNQLNRRLGGIFADSYCDYHEDIVHNWTLQKMLVLYTQANYKTILYSIAFILLIPKDWLQWRKGKDQEVLQVAPPAY